jgi:hypothetical protein
MTTWLVLGVVLATMGYSFTHGVRPRSMDCIHDIYELLGLAGR